MEAFIKSTTVRLSAMIAAFAFIFAVFAAPAPVHAQQGQGSGLGSVLGGAAVGAIIGGAVKGKKGALVGAGVGAAAGAAAAARARNNPPPPPRPAYVAPRQPVYSNNLVYNIQLSLTNLGYNPGPVDGVYGRRTGDAIAAYEYNNQLPVTGQASDSIYYHMKQQGG